MKQYWLVWSCYAVLGALSSVKGPVVIYKKLAAGSADEKGKRDIFVVYFCGAIGFREPVAWTMTAFCSNGCCHNIFICYRWGCRGDYCSDSQEVPGRLLGSVLVQPDQGVAHIPLQPQTVARRPNPHHQALRTLPPLHIFLPGHLYGLVDRCHHCPYCHDGYLLELERPAATAFWEEAELNRSDDRCFILSCSFRFTYMFFSPLLVAQ